MKPNESRQFQRSSKSIRPTSCTQTGWDTGLRRSLVLVNSLADLASESSHGAYHVGRSKSTTEPNVEAHTWDKPTLHRRREMGLSESWNALPSFHCRCFKGPDLLTLPATPGCVTLAIRKHCCAEHTALAYKENRGQAELCCSESLPLILTLLPICTVTFRSKVKKSTAPRCPRLVQPGRKRGRKPCLLEEGVAWPWTTKAIVCLPCRPPSP